MSNDLTLTDIKTVVDEAMKSEVEKLLLLNTSTTRQFVSIWIMLSLSLSKLVMILSSDLSVKN
jgi:hypothetical protein